MSYFMEKSFDNFHMTAENYEAAQRAIATITDKYILDTANAWVITPETDGSVREIEFNGNRYSEDINFFVVIAPYVTSNSVIELEGEDGEHWYYLFKDGEVKEYSGEFEDYE